MDLLMSGLELEGGIRTMVLTIVWLIAIAIGVAEYARSKGRMGRALMATLGGGVLLTFVVAPDILTEQIPDLIQSAFDWILGATE